MIRLIVISIALFSMGCSPQQFQAQQDTYDQAAMDAEADAIIAEYPELADLYYGEAAGEFQAANVARQFWRGCTSQACINYGLRLVEMAKKNKARKKRRRRRRR